MSKTLKASKKLGDEGFLEVGTDGEGNVVVNHPDIDPDEEGVGHIVFSPAQARAFALSVLKNAAKAAIERNASNA
jgi:hypothetical protein